jgi:filamentous hemagglutinin family protein
MKLRSFTAAGLLILTMADVYASPSGGQVTTGSGSIVQRGKVSTIYQHTDKLGIDWQGFNIGADEIVNFVQPSCSAVALNRIVGCQASTIYGQLNANGKVFLVNPSGILFAPGAQVNVGGLVASALNITDGDFRSGNYKFSGANSGFVVNQGTIHAADGGYVALFGQKVKNEGVIVVKQGSIMLGAGSAVTMDMDGDNLVRVVVDQGAIEALAENKNLIQADAGKVLMTARTANMLSGTVVNNSGIIRARSINNINGNIILDGGTVTNSGILDASGKETGQTGGTVKVLGDKISLLANAEIDVAGNQGGGIALLGGNFQGKGIEQNASQTIVQANAAINADAIANGNGGKVVVWANDKTVFQGSISARGGLEGGNGGMAEVSGKQTLLYQGNTDLRAVKGSTGRLLLDPKDIIIASSGGTLSGAALSAAIDGADVALQADNNISVLDNVTASAASHGLKLQAGNSIILDNGARISLQQGNFTAVINDAGATPVNRDAGSAKFQMFSGTAIETNGGAVNVLPGSFSGAKDGYVQLDSGASINAGGGSIDITGITASGADKGINISSGSSIITVGSGTISLNGTGRVLPASGTVTNYSGGVNIIGTVESANGDITITGLGRGNGNNNCGVLIDSGKVTTTGIGNINITGTGTETFNAGADGNFGVYIANSGAAVQTVSGNITINGTSNGAGNGSNHGVILKDNAVIQSTGSGNIGIAGISGQGIDDNYGVQISNSTIKATDGNMIITGNSRGQNIRNAGLVINGSSLIASAGTAPLILQGNGSILAASAENYGIWLLGNLSGSPVIQAIDANVAISGTSGRGTINNKGVYIEAGLIGTAGGTVTISGNGNGSTSFNKGVQLDANAMIQATGNGKINITGTGGNATFAGETEYNNGIYLNGGGISAAAGDVTLNGVGGSGSNGKYNVGVLIENSGQITSSNGKISIYGTAGNGVHNNYGIQLDSNAKITSQNGDIALVGIGHGSQYFNAGIVLSGNSTIESTGIGVNAATINLNGTGGSGGSSGGIDSRDAYGIWFNTGTVMSKDGNILLTGTAGNGAAYYNSGFRIDTGAQLTSTGSADIIINGFGGGGDHQCYGVHLDGGIVTSDFGNITITGNGGNAQGAFNAGIAIDGNSTIQSILGNTRFTGIGGNGTWDNYGVWVRYGTVKNVDGSIILDGVAKGTGTNNSGIRIDSGNLLQTTGQGEIHLTGRGADGAAGNGGIWMLDGRISTYNGDAILVGNGGNATGNVNTGIRMENGTLEASGSGNIHMIGTGGNALNENYGIILQQGSITSTSGNINLSGYGHGVESNNTGIRINSNLQLNSSGPGTISLYGIGSVQGTSQNYGVLLDQNQISNTNGNVSITGIGGGNGTAGSNIGVLLNGNTFNPGGNATITINGTKGNGISGNDGVVIEGNVNTATNKLIVSADNISLNGTVSSAASGNAIVLAAQNSLVINGTMGISNSLGRWLVYVPSAGSWIGDYLANNYSFTQYGTAFNSGSGIIPYNSADIQGYGNGLVYSTTLNFTQSLVGSVSKIYDGSKTANNLVAGNYQVAGVPGFTASIISAPTIGTYIDKNVGSGILVSAAPATLSVKDNNNKPVFGYSSSNATGNIGSITPKSVTAIGGTVVKEYDGTRTANLGSNYTLSGILAGEEGFVGLSGTGGLYNSKDVLNANKVTFSNISLTGSGAGNYALVTMLNDFNNNGAGLVGKINKAPLKIIASPNTKLEDGTIMAKAMPSVIGLKGTDTVSNLMEVYSDSNAGTGKRLDVSSYTINDGSNGGNYQVSTVSNLSGIIVKEDKGQVNQAQSFDFIGNIVQNKTTKSNKPIEGGYQADLIKIINSGVSLTGAIEDSGLFTLYTKAGGKVNVVAVIVDGRGDRILAITASGNQMTINQESDAFKVDFTTSTANTAGCREVTYAGNQFILSQASTATIDMAAERKQATFSLVYNNGQTDIYQLEFIGTTLRISAATANSHNISRQADDIGRLVISVGLRIAKDEMGISPKTIKSVEWKI